MKPAFNRALDDSEAHWTNCFRKERRLIVAIKKQTKTVAEEMLEALQAFASDLKDSPAKDVKATYRHRAVKVDFRPRDYDSQSVKQLRLSLGCSQRVFADFIGVSVETLRNWEQGIHPTSGVAARLFDEMRINPGYWRTRLQQSLKERKAS